MEGINAPAVNVMGKSPRQEHVVTQLERMHGFILSMHPKALKEIAVFFVAATALSFFTGHSVNYQDVAIHPYWIIVLLTAVQYGLRESLFAAGIATGMLFIGQLPEQLLSETLYGYGMRILTIPALWSLAALILGGIRTQQDAYRMALETKAQQNEAAAHTIREAYERLKRRKETLEFRLAAQRETSSGMQSVVSTLFQEDEDEVFLRLPEAVHHWLQAESVSVYRRGEEGLQLVASLGWAPDAAYHREFLRGSPVYKAVCEEKRILSFLDESDARVMGQEGMLMTPLTDAEGYCLGMLKVENLPLDLLTPQTQANLRQLGLWAGMVIGRHRMLVGTDKKVPALRVVPQEELSQTAALAGA